MLIATLVLGTITFAQTKAVIVQTELDRAGFSCNAIDGVWGGKSVRAEALYAAARGQPPAATAEDAYRAHFKDLGSPYRWDVVTAEDLAALVAIPADPAGKQELEAMGYESVKEMFAERGHVSPRALERLNPKIAWDQVKVGDRIRIPDFPSMDEELDAWPRNRPGAPSRPLADLVRISLSRCEVTVYDRQGKCRGLFPCSIARDKAKLPPHGELRVTTTIPRPNYTYTPDYTPPGQKVRRYVFPPGPNCPVGIAWIGLNLPGYGIHGTPRPESIGQAESHGCFRLANWNAARLYAMVRPGVRVLIEP